MLKRTVWTILSLLVIIVSAAPLSEDWETRVVPLRSNRADVEKYLGRASSENCTTCIYETDESKVEVSYSTGPCDGKLAGWNVPPNIVLSYVVEPKNPPELKSMGLRIQGMLIRGGDDGTRYLLDVERGIEYTVSPDSHVGSKLRLPLDSDNDLRCDGFPKYCLAGFLYPTSDLFRDVNIQDGFDHIATALATVGQIGDDARLFAVAYAGENLKSRKYRDYLSNLRMFVDKRLPEHKKYWQIIDGGCKTTFEVQLFLLRSTDRPPSPKPDLPSTKCMK